jgi:hypothetical protein
MNIDFSTLCLISIPGFLLGLMTGRFISRSWFVKLRNSLGAFGRLLSGLVFVGYVGVTLIILSIMVVYLLNLPETAKASSFWTTLLFAFWMVVNLVFDFLDLTDRRKSESWKKAGLS